MELNKETEGTNTRRVGTYNTPGTSNVFIGDGMWSGATQTYFNTWGNPERVSVEEVEDTIEMIFIEISLLALTVYPPHSPGRRVFKIIYSCKEGKWNKSEKIYGEIIPSQEEDYIFE